MTPNPWTTLDSREVYTNPWMRVREDRVVRPDGQEGIYGVIEPTRLATGAVPLTDAGEIVLVGQWRYPLETYSWEIPEGGADAGESPEEAARRELREEAGLIAGSLEPLGGETHLSNCLSAERAYLFLARDLSEVPPDPDGTEELRRRTVSFNEAIAMVENGEITDAMTVMGLLLTERRLRG